MRSHKQPGGVLVSLARGGGGLGVMVNKSSSTANLVMVGFLLLGTCLAAAVAAWSWGKVYRVCLKSNPTVII